MVFVRKCGLTSMVFVPKCGLRGCGPSPSDLRAEVRVISVSDGADVRVVPLDRMVLSATVAGEIATVQYGDPQSSESTAFAEQVVPIARVDSSDLRVDGST